MTWPMLRSFTVGQTRLFDFLELLYSRCFFTGWNVWCMARRRNAMRIGTGWTSVLRLVTWENAAWSFLIFLRSGPCTLATWTSFMGQMLNPTMSWIRMPV